MKKSTNTENNFIAVITGIIILGVWEMWVRIANIAECIIPAPSVILITLFKTLPLMSKHIFVTLYTAFTAFMLSIMIAFIIAVCMDEIPIFRKAVYPFIVITQTIPIIFIYPLLAIWFGLGLLPKIVVITLTCFFPIVMSFIDGLGNIDSELLDLFKSMGANKWETFWMVKFPGSMPSFFSGLKIAATYSIVGAVISEWLGAQYGMGIYMIRAYKTFSTPRVFAAIIVVIILSIGVFKIVKLCERIFMPWNLPKK